MIELAMAYPKGFALTLIALAIIIGVSIVEILRVWANSKKAEARVAMIAAHGWPPAHLDGDGNPIERDWFAENQASEDRISRFKAGITE